MTKIGVLSNPLSRNNLKHLGELQKFLGEHQDVLHLQLTDFNSLPTVLRDFAEQAVDILVVNGGDGTVSAVLTELFEHRAFPEPPLLAVLPGGTSNTIAGDVGLRGDPSRSLERLFVEVASGTYANSVATRGLIRVHYDATKSAVVGMFFGTAAICDAIVLRRRIFPQQWLPDSIAGALTLIYVLANIIAGRGGKVLSSQPIGIDVDQGKSAVSRYSLVMITTLRRVFLGSSPFWGGGDRTLKITSVRSPTTGLALHAYRLLYGRDKHKLPGATYQSANGDRIELQMACPFNLDGEFFQPSTDSSVTLTGPYTARFVQC